jgi:hypothetical protein
VKYLILFSLKERPKVGEYETFPTLLLLVLCGIFKAQNLKTFLVWALLFWYTQLSQVERMFSTFRIPFYSFLISLHVTPSIGLLFCWTQSSSFSNAENFIVDYLYHPIPVTARPKTEVCYTILLGLGVWILPGAWQFVICECCVLYRYRPLWRADPPSKEVLPSVCDTKFDQVQNHPRYPRWVCRTGRNKKICLCQKLVISNYYQKLELSTDTALNHLKAIPYTNVLILPAL